MPLASPSYPLSMPEQHSQLFPEEPLHPDNPRLLQLLHLILELSSLILYHTDAEDPIMGGSQLCSSGERVPLAGSRQNQRRTLQRTNSSNRIDTNETIKVAHDKFRSFGYELNRLRLWEVDVAEAELEATLVEGSPMYEPIKRILSQIANVVIAVLPREFLPVPKVAAIINQIQMSTGAGSPVAGRIMMTTKDHEIKEVHGPVILEAMRKSVDDLVDLWDFMELAQQKLESFEPSSIPISRKRRGYLDSAEDEVHAGLEITGNKRRFVERSDPGT